VRRESIVVRGRATKNDRVRGASDLIVIEAAKLKKRAANERSNARAGGTAAIERANYSLRFVASRKF
jgi:hypothetical protein